MHKVKSCMEHETKKTGKGGGKFACQRSALPAVLRVFVQCLSSLLLSEMEIILAHLYDRALRRERRFRDRLDPLQLSDSECLLKYRFPRQELILLFQEMEAQLQRRTRRSHALPTHTQVLLALRFFASGSFQYVIGDTVGKILYCCCILSKC